MDWYCITGGTQRGPLSFDELLALKQAGTLRPEDYVWNESFGSQWRTAREVAELAEDAPAAFSPAQPATPLTGVHGRRPSFVLALRQAWDYTQQTLFRQGSFLRWMGLAFCVWIAIIGLNEPYLVLDLLARQATPDPELMAQLQSATTPEEMLTLYQDLIRQIVENLSAHLTPAFLQGVLASWLLVLLLTGWLRARGAFMVMHRWQHVDAPLGQAWKAGAGELGHSLFLFRAGVGIILCGLLALLGQYFQGTIWQPLLDGEPFGGELAVRAFLLSLAVSLLLTLWFTVAILTTHFVVPVMYWRRVGVLPAWRVVIEFCNKQPTPLTIYFTMYFVLIHAVMLAALVGSCCTCCCVSYLIVIPFVNGILCLPATFFFRGLGVQFLRQWRPDLECAPPKGVP
jgi:hypothetical protein